MIATLTHQASGINFNFGVYTPFEKWPPDPGLYLFAQYNARSGRYDVLYVGQCNDFSTRLCAHERWDEASRKGMTHVLLTKVPTQAERDKYEQILIRDQDPPMNTHFRPLA